MHLGISEMYLVIPRKSEAIADAIRNLDLKGDQEINWESFYREMMKCGLAEEEIRSMFYVRSTKYYINDYSRFLSTIRY